MLVAYLLLNGWTDLAKLFFGPFQSPRLAAKHLLLYKETHLLKTCTDSGGGGGGPNLTYFQVKHYENLKLYLLKSSTLTNYSLKHFIYRLNHQVLPAIRRKQQLRTRRNLKRQQTSARDVSATRLQIS